MLEKILDFFSARINTTVLFFFIYAIFLISPFLYAGANTLAGHDYLFHQLITQQIGVAMDGGQFPARVMPDMAFGFGYGTGIFYSQLPHLASYLFSRLPFFDVHSAIVLVYFLGYFFSGYAFYKMMLYLGKTESSAAVGGLLYMSLPYHIIDVFYRNAYAEAFCFMLLPLVLMGFVKLVKEQKILMLALSFSAIALSHNITALYTFIFLLVGCLFYFKSFLDRKVIIAALKAAGLVLLLTGFFIVPFIEHRFFNTHGTSYQVFILGDQLAKSVLENIVQIGQLFYWPFGQNDLRYTSFIDPAYNAQFHYRMPLFVGAYLLLLFAAAVLWPSSRKGLRANLPFVFLGLLTLFATTAYFPWHRVPGILLNIQFPWRLLIFAGFFICIAAADVFSKISVRETRFALVAVAIVGMFYTVRIVSPLPIKPKFSDRMVSQIDSLHGQVGSGEYFPAPARWSYQQYLERKKTPLRRHGHADISEFKREKNGRFSFAVNMEKDARDEIELPLFYYMGYDIRFFPAAGGPARAVRYYENERGMATIRAEGSGTIKAGYRGTAADRISTAVSLAALFLIAFLGLQRGRNRKEAQPC